MSQESGRIADIIRYIEEHYRDTSVKKVADQFGFSAEYLGYQNTTNLIRSFRNYSGTTPARYRSSRKAIQAKEKKAELGGR